MSTVRAFFSFYRRYQHRIEEEEISDIAQKALGNWKQEGYFESLSLGQLTLDSAALLFGIKTYSFLLAKLSITSPSEIYISFALSLVTIYLSRQLIPTIGQANLSQWSRPVYLFYSIYWGATGWLGRLVFKAKELLLKRSGFHKKYKIFSEKDIQSMDGDVSGLEEDEVEMVQNVINIGNTLVKEIFTPRVDCVALNVTSSYEEILETIRTDKFTRIPVYKSNIDKIVGILHVKDLLFIPNITENFSLKDHLREAYFIPRSKKVDDLMSEFKKDKSHLAIVVDEYGGTAGLITLEDILEEIVGEIQDEDDSETPKISRLTETHFEIDPIITLDDINKELNLHIKPKEEVDIDTLGGYLQYIKGCIPQEGETIAHNGYSFEILKMEGQSIEKVLLTIETKN